MTGNDDSRQCVGIVKTNMNPSPVQTEVTNWFTATNLVERIDMIMSTALPS